MIENDTNKAVENGFETENETENETETETGSELLDNSVTENSVDSTENGFEADSESVDEPVSDDYSESTEADIENTLPMYAPIEERNMPFKDILTFAQNNFFNSKACNTILFFLNLIITSLCAIQIAIWGVSIYNTFNKYYDYCTYVSYENYDYNFYISVGVSVLITIFIVVLLFHVIKSIISLIKKEHEHRFESVSTLFAFYVFYRFITGIFNWNELLIDDFSILPYIGIPIIILMVLYAIVRLFLNDFRLRIRSFVFSSLASILVLVMFSTPIGNFSAYTEVSDLNTFTYIIQYIEQINNPEISMMLFSIIVANILPFAALSLIGYLMYGLVGRYYIQFYGLQSCKKVSITMLIVSILSLIINVIGRYALNISYFEPNYPNITITILFCILLIILTSLPWTIYNKKSKKHYESYQNRRGDD